MSLRVYNTLSRKKEPFETLKPGQVTMYVCGPTVYDRAHIGHAMSSLVFDVIRRYLEHIGYDVRHVMNYTDVDDKIILRAMELGVDPMDLGERYIQEYQRHIDDLNILPATVFPRATQEIDQIIEMIEGLIERDYAYAADGDVYFRVTHDADYGKLSGRQLEDMQAGARIGVDERKEHPMDFTLWKASKEGEPAWDSPWGQGRPGWHIECSAMSLNHLGEQIDIHGGGSDLIFPHHENEIAQTESLTGETFARYWMHNGMLQLSGEKMSKSLGNLVTIEEFLDNHDPDALRMLVLNSSYRTPLAYSEEVAVQAEKAIARLRSALRPAYPSAGGLSKEAKEALQDQLNATREGFEQAMSDDFNTAGALGHVFDLVRWINHSRDNGGNADELAEAQEVVRELTAIFGLRLDRIDDRFTQAEPFIDLLIAVRRDLRDHKLWDLADKIRDQLLEHGVVLEDSQDETTWRWK